MLNKDDQITLAKNTTKHVLNAICDDPRKYWLLGEGTESWSKLTECHAALHGHDAKVIRLNFKPDQKAWDHFTEEREKDEELLRAAKESRPAEVKSKTQITNTELIDVLIAARDTIEDYQKYSDEMSKIGRGHIPMANRYGFSPEYLIAFINQTLNKA